MTRLGLLIILAVAASMPLAAQQPAPAFEVASIKPSSPDPIPVSGLGSLRLPPDRWRAVRVNLLQLIGVAYPEHAFEGRVVAGPAWIREALFDIDAKKDPDTSLSEVAPMMAQLLAERFALRMHVEPRAVDVYVLKMSRDDGQFGPQLRRSAASCIEAKTAQQPAPPECRRTSSSGLNLLTNQIADFLQYLSFVRIDRPVVDRTGLTGYVDIQLHYDYAPFNGAFVRNARTEGVSFFTALQEQLGLKLEPSREVLDVLVIDSVNRPTPD